MTPAELKAACKALAAMVAHPKAWVHASVSQDSRGSVAIYTRGACPDRGDVSAFTIRVEGTDWAAMFADAEAKWRVESEKRNGRLVEEMALEIIRLTAEFGQCSDAALRAKYGPLVATLSDAAVSRANEMAANGPFSVVRLAAANAA